MSSDGMQVTTRTVFTVSAFLFLNFACRALSDDLQVRYFQGLRDRGLFLIAEDYAVSQLNGSHLLPDDRATLTIQLAQTLIDHGRVTTTSQREELWNEAKRLLTQFIKDRHKNPRLIAVRAELAMLPARFGETLAWELKINPANQKIEQSARAEFQQAIQNIGTTLIELEKKRINQVRVQSQMGRSISQNSSTSGKSFSSLF